MTRPVSEILEQARRENWPTSSIDAMANHHLCGIAREYVNDCSADPSREKMNADPNCGRCGGEGSYCEVTASGAVLRRCGC